MQPERVMEVMKKSTFDEQLERIDESLRSSKANNSKLIESVVEVKNAQKEYHDKQKVLAAKEAEIKHLQAVNKEIKRILMNALIERDEYETKKAALVSANDRLSNLNENLHKEIEDLLRGDEVDSICERFSFSDQNSLLKDIQDTRRKLIQYGFSLNFFA